MRLVLLVMTAAIIVVTWDTPPAAAQDLRALEATAAAALTRNTDPFGARVDLVERLRVASENAPTAEQRGRLALLWLRSVRWLLDAVPFGAADQPPYREWLAQHESLVAYSEPAGQWLLSPEMLWIVHDAHRASAAGDDIAWFAVENGYPGECEGYIPCYANLLNWLEGEYLRRHPRGRHATAAVAQIRTGIGNGLDLLKDSSARDFLNPATDCGDLKDGLVPLRRAVVQTPVMERSAAIAAIDRLLARCP